MHAVIVQSHIYCDRKEAALGKIIKERNQVVTSNILLRATKFLY